MDSEKKLTLGINTKPAESAIDSLKRKVDELAVGTMESSDRQAKSSKDVLRFLEEEARMYERINALQLKTQEYEIRGRLRDDPANEGLKKELSDNKFEQTEGRLAAEMYREKMDELIATVKEEAERDRQKTTDELGRTPVSERTNKQHLQAAALGMEGPEAEDEMNRRGRLAGGVRGYGMAILGGRDAVGMGLNVASEAGGDLMQMGGKAGIIGAAVMLGAMAGKKIWDTSAEYFKAAARSSAVTGMETAFSDNDLYTKYGIAPAEAAGRRVPLARARRSAAGLNQSLTDQILFEKGIGLETGDYNAVDQLALLSNSTGGSQIQSAIAAMREGGIVKGEDMSAVPDYLSIMVQLSKEQVAKLGRVDMGVNMRMVGALATIDETLQKSPEALANVVNAVRGGLTNAASPQMQALQYSVLQRINPGADMQSLMEMRENPFSQESIRYYPEMLKQLRSISPNKRQFYMNLPQAFPGLSAFEARKMGEAFEAGTIDDYLKKDFTGEKGVKGLGARAEAGTSAQEVAAAAMDSVITQMGVDVGAIRTVLTANDAPVVTKRVTGNEDLYTYRGFYY